MHTKNASQTSSCYSMFSLHEIGLNGTVPRRTMRIGKARDKTRRMLEATEFPSAPRNSQSSVRVAVPSVRRNCADASTWSTLSGENGEGLEHSCVRTEEIASSHSSSQRRSSKMSSSFEAVLRWDLYCRRRCLSDEVASFRALRPKSSNFDFAQSDIPIGHIIALTLAVNPSPELLTRLVTTNDSFESNPLFVQRCQVDGPSRSALGLCVLLRSDTSKRVLVRRTVTTKQLECN